MATAIGEWYGHMVSDGSPAAVDHRARQWCRFVEAPCNKRFPDKSPNGVCSLSVGDERVPICPMRMYENLYQVLHEVMLIAFGPGMTLVRPDRAAGAPTDGTKVVAFGKGFGRELKVPTPAGGAYSVDWVLARVDGIDQLAEFVAVEIQTIDTTGSYKPEVRELRNGTRSVSPSRANLNWENVNKRILPQLIYKGHVLRHEPMCTKGLFFVCPTPVYKRIVARLGGEAQLMSIHPSSGSLTFHHYDLEFGTGNELQLAAVSTRTTTVDAVAFQFVSPTNLPPPGAYESEIRRALGNR